MPSIGCVNAIPPVDPKNGAFPNVKIPPSDATIQ
jgi:hypothetical protein